MTLNHSTKLHEKRGAARRCKFRGELGSFRKHRTGGFKDFALPSERSPCFSRDSAEISCRCVPPSLSFSSPPRSHPRLENRASETRPSRHVARTRRANTQPEVLGRIRRPRRRACTNKRTSERANEQTNKRTNNAPTKGRTGGGWYVTRGRAHAQDRAHEGCSESESKGAKAERRRSPAAG